MSAIQQTVAAYLRARDTIAEAGQAIQTNRKIATKALREIEDYMNKNGLFLIVMGEKCLARRTRRKEVAPSEDDIMRRLCERMKPEQASKIMELVQGKSTKDVTTVELELTPSSYQVASVNELH